MAKKYVQRKWRPVESKSGVEYAEEGSLIYLRAHKGDGIFQEYGPVRLVANSVDTTIRHMLKEMGIA